MFFNPEWDIILGAEETFKANYQTKQKGVETTYRLRRKKPEPEPEPEPEPAKWWQFAKKN